jgi:hypothetical protein
MELSRGCTAVDEIPSGKPSEGPQPRTGDGRGCRPATAPRIWAVGALCRAIADALEARFNPVAVRGEITGFSRAASGHCYFTLKDAQGQIRCAMFRRSASLLDFVPARRRPGRSAGPGGRLRTPRRPAADRREPAPGGAGRLFEQFLRLKAKLEAEGLFDRSASGTCRCCRAASASSPRSARRRCTTW